MDGRGDLEELFRREGRTLWRSLYAYTGGRREIADDAVAEAFARALGSATPIREPLAWLYRVAYRIAAAEMKREGKTEVIVDSQTRADGGETIDLVDALRKLSPAQRAAVYLHYQADQPVDSVARMLGMSRSAVKVHLFRGRRRLQGLLEVNDDD